MEFKLFNVAEGRVVRLESLRDSVFSKGLLGAGYGVYPHNGRIHAPISGKVSVIMPTRHAFAIEWANHFEVLVHMGINTIAMETSAPFELLFTEGDQLQAGEQIAFMDLALIDQAGKDLTIAVAITSMDLVKEFEVIQTGYMEAGDLVAWGRAVGE
ncbi:PTS sugar transporter subunit IIA [Hutsoniella sourekii]